MNKQDGINEIADDTDEILEDTEAIDEKTSSIDKKTTWLIALWIIDKLIMALLILWLGR